MTVADEDGVGGDGEILRLHLGVASDTTYFNQAIGFRSFRWLQSGQVAHL